MHKVLIRHKKWIEETVGRIKEKNEKYPEPDEKMKRELKEKAKRVIPEKVKYYSTLTGLTPINVKITSAKKRFGSCSGKNSLCFSYLLMQYPDECIDYVVLHEIAHIKHHNHSKDFYSLVAKHMPDYKKREKLLKA